MQMPDVNVLLYAFDQGSAHHATAVAFLEQARASDQPLAVYHGVLSSFVRLSVNPKASRKPLKSTAKALEFCRVLLESPNVIPVLPGHRHWKIFERLCDRRALPYDVIPDAYYAAIAIEAGCEWVTFDSDFALFAGLRWRWLVSDQRFTNPT